MTVKELIKLLKKYPDQNMKIKIMDSEYGDLDPDNLEDQRVYVGCAHYPKLGSNMMPIPGTGTYFHNKSCRTEIMYVGLVGR